jgi:hypothetical protein
MQIDVKKGPLELVLLVGNLIKDRKRERNTVWGSFRHSISNLCFKHFGTEIPLFFSLSRALLAKALWHIGLFPYMELKESCLIMPNVTALMSVGWISAMKARGVSVIVFVRRILCK